MPHDHAAPRLRAARPRCWRGIASPLLARGSRSNHHDQQFVGAEHAVLAARLALVVASVGFDAFGLGAAADAEPGVVECRMVAFDGLGDAFERDRRVDAHGEVLSKKRRRSWERRRWIASEQRLAGAARASAGPKAGRRGKSNRSERDFAGEITTGGRRPAIVAAARLVGAAAVAAAVEEGQRAGVGGEVDLGAVAVVPLVVLPLAGGQLPLDEHLRALDEVLLGDLAEGFVPDHHFVPLGPLDAVAVVVLPALAGRDVEGDDPLAALLPPWVVRTSGSRPMLPISCTRLR